MHELKQILCGIFSICLMGGPLTAQEPDHALRDRFLKGVSETQEIVDGLCFRAQVVLTGDYASLSDKMKADFKKLSHDPSKPNTTLFECAFRGPMCLEAGTQGNGISFVMAKNSEYAFRVERPTDDLPYSLTFVEQHGSSADTQRLVDEAEMRARVVPLATWYLFGKPLSHFVESPFFKLKSISYVESTDSELVRVEFDHDVEDPERKLERLSNAFIVCNAANHWALQEYGATLWQGAVYHATMQPGENVDGFPVAKHRTLMIPNVLDPASVRRNESTIDVLTKHVPREEFYLTHYGLPEPNFGESWLGTWGWYLIGGIGCIVVGVITIKWRNNRNESPEQRTLRSKNTRGTGELRRHFRGGRS
ncbi:MAG: hypothetical protein KDB05_22960 [Planctomycetales bacterium]|nr:hypothetical protein [Planctomycetales bacterium]